MKPLSPGHLFGNMLIAGLNGFACGINCTIIAIGDSPHPALTGGLVVLNGGVTVFIAAVTAMRLSQQFRQTDK